MLEQFLAEIIAGILETDRLSDDMAQKLEGDIYVHYGTKREPLNSQWGNLASRNQKHPSIMWCIWTKYGCCTASFSVLQTARCLTTGTLPHRYPLQLTSQDPELNSEGWRLIKVLWSLVIYNCCSIYRYVAYRRLCYTIWHHLRHRVRRVLRSCAVVIICKTFPSADGLYNGFTTASTERSFPTLHYLKTYLHSTMKEDWLNGLAKMQIHHDIHTDPESE